MLSRKRFLDDLFFGWEGTANEFTVFKLTLNEIGVGHGITSKGEVSSSVDFLDTTVTLYPNSSLSTRMYVKPTDATRYLHRRSDHSPHTFYSIPFSQFRRVVVLCSNPDEKLRCIDYIAEKLVNSGFQSKEISIAKEKALKLDRDIILAESENRRSQPTSTTDKQLTFLINRNGHMCNEIKKVIRECNPDIDRLLGTKTRIIVAERRNLSIASTVFAKASFSRIDPPINETQKCKDERKEEDGIQVRKKRGRKCGVCDIMNLKQTVTLWKNNDTYKKTVKLDFSCTCATECVIYLYVCNICKDNDSFYVGQSQNSTRERANGHRAKFTPDMYTKSALSYHIYRDHPQFTSKKLTNYSLGVIKSTNAENLDKDEDYYNELLHAKLSLNRYKVTL